MVMGFAIIQPVIKESPIRLLIALPFFLFLPGYVLLAVLFPKEGESRRNWKSFTSVMKYSRSRQFGKRGITRVERMALSFGISLAILPVLALVIGLLPVGFSPVSVFVIVGVFILVGAVLGSFRRFAVPSDRRYTLSVGDLPTNSADSLLDHALSFILIVSIVVALSVAAYALAVPADGPGFTNLSLGTRTDTGGFSASGYPTEFKSGNPQELTIAIENHEGEPTRYSVVVVIQRLDERNGQSVVVEQRQLDRLTTSVGHEEIAYIPHTVETELTGNDLRLVYLLYKSEPPSQPTVDNAYRSVYLRIDVTD